jgi:hypothetical protein
MADKLVERLRFHGRYAGETQDECTIRKNSEREQAASLINEAVAKLRGLLDANGNMARNRAAGEAEAFLSQLKGKQQ